MKARRSLFVCGSTVIGALLLAGGTALSAVGPAAAQPSATNPSSALPVLGSTVVTQNREAGAIRATALVHGVRRIPGATVLYFSMGLPAGAAKVDWVQLGRPQSDRRYSTSSTDIGRQQLIDMAGNRVYSVLVDAQQNALASPKAAWPFDGEAGKFYLMYQIVPELPASLTTVDVLIGNGDAIHDVPVTDGVLEPAVEQTGPLLLGAGWPKIDQAAAKSSVTPEESIRPVQTETSDLERTVTKRSTEGSVSVDLSADVLFAVDSAKLSAAAAAKIKLAADQINEGAAAGRIQVVGHTDNTGSTAHNLDLSKRRAQSVTDALKPLVTVAGVTFEVTGQGERNPVASNGTSAGRKENRRVSAVFTPKEGQ
jgi:outer membrane protein OmpA-like peptidoglycan-associated protein